MGAVNWLARTRAANIALAATTSATIALATPLLWTTWRPRWLPWYLESYINGVHTLDKPQPWLFPIFPWTAFAFAGLAVGFLLFSEWSRKNLGLSVALFALGGVALYKLAIWVDSRPTQIYSVYDFWHTSPNFFLARVGVLCVIIGFAYAWCRWGIPRWIFSPVVQLGQTSLLVYWVHIEFVYGRFSILKKHAQTIPSATLGLAIIFTSMVLLSVLRTRMKGRGAEIWSGLRRRWQPATSENTVA
jgi:fucose 4-O-acetylase-like acetyltransferase